MAEQKGERGMLRTKALSDEHRENPFAPPAETVDKKRHESQEFVEKHHDKIFIMEIGGKSKDELVAEIEHAGMKIYDFAKDMMDSKDFRTLKNPEEIKLIRLTVEDLGFDELATADQIFARAKELGLELCPPETGPQYRLAHPDQPMRDHVSVAMNPIADRSGRPCIFNIDHGPGGLWLSNRDVYPRDEWSPDLHLLFRLPKLDAEKLEPKEEKEAVLQRLKNLISW